MSSFNLKSLATVVVVAGLSLGLSACFRPLYGPTASGESLQTVLASIDVPDMDWPPSLANTGHYLRSELVYALNGSGSDTPKRYRLRMSLRESQSSPVVDLETGTASSVIVAGTLTYTLTSLDGKTVVTQRTATSSTSFDAPAAGGPVTGLVVQPASSARRTRAERIISRLLISENILLRLLALPADIDFFSHAHAADPFRPEASRRAGVQASPAVDPRGREMALFPARSAQARDHPADRPDDPGKEKVAL